MTNADIRRHGHIGAEATEILNAAAGRLHISACSYMRAVKVGRTIADLEHSEQITAGHISEALAYRAPSSSYRHFTWRSTYARVTA